jgi:hypothetical protein
MYGENGGHLRAELTTLLRQHRIQQRLGGPGIHTVPETTTPQEREELGKQIARFRHAVLVWCLQAVRAANPRINLEGTSGRTRGPAEELRYRLTAAVDASSAGLPRWTSWPPRRTFRWWSRGDEPRGQRPSESTTSKLGSAMATSARTSA